MKKKSDYAFSVHRQKRDVRGLVLQLIFFFTLTGSLTVSASPHSERMKINPRDKNVSFENIPHSIGNTSDYIITGDAHPTPSLGKEIGR